MRIAMASAIHDAIVREVSSWPGVTVGRHRFGGTEFRYGRRDLGHLHGSRLADLPFPLLVRNDLVAAGRVEPHHVHPDSGWVSFVIRGESDVPHVLALFRLNYDRPWTDRTSIAVADKR
jgi:luciferase-like monooxygenase